MLGTVKFYNRDKGYGFIYCEELEKDFFFGIGDWKNASAPETNDDVEFEVIDAIKGKKAITIKLIKTANIKKQETFDKSDDRIKCPNCNKKIVPRMVFYRGEPQKSVCPYCATKIENYESINYLLIGIVIVGIIMFSFFGLT